MRTETLNWTFIQTFLTVAKTGSLTAAAQKLGLSQPTVGRHIKLTEKSLGVELFTRDVKGLTLTEAGVSLLEPANEMANASAKLSALASGREKQLSGTVRLTASVVVSHYLIPSIVATIRKKEPEIEIELLPSDTSENLIFREADIAIRMYRPTQLDIITKHLFDQPLALYATTSLLKKWGSPKNLEELVNLPFVGFDRSELIINVLCNLGCPVDRHYFGVRCDNQSAYWELVRARCGVGAMQTSIGDKDQHVVKLEYQPELPTLPFWLAAPKALRTNMRIKRVWDLLIEELAKKFSEPAKDR